MALKTFAAHRILGVLFKFFNTLNRISGEELKHAFLDGCYLQGLKTRPLHDRLIYGFVCLCDFVRLQAPFLRVLSGRFDQEIHLCVKKDAPIDVSHAFVRVERTCALCVTQRTRERFRDFFLALHPCLRRQTIKVQPPPRTSSVALCH